MENQSNNNNNKLQICSTTQKVQLSSTKNVSSVTSSSITHIWNHRLFNPRLNRLTVVKRLIRNRPKTTSTFLALHMCSHYKAQEDKPKMSQAEAVAKARENHALRDAMAKLKKARKQKEELTVLAQGNAKALPSTRPNSFARAAAARASAPAPVPARARARARSPKDITAKLVVVKHEVFPDEDVKPPPGFQHLLATDPDGRPFIIKKVKVEFHDDAVVAYGSSNNLDLKL